MGNGGRLHVLVLGVCVAFLVADKNFRTRQHTRKENIMRGDVRRVCTARRSGHGKLGDVGTKFNVVTVGVNAWALAMLQCGHLRTRLEMLREASVWASTRRRRRGERGGIDKVSI